jgi:hypothetical protein
VKEQKLSRREQFGRQPAGKEDVGHLEETLTDLTRSTAEGLKKYQMPLLLAVGAVVLIIAAVMVVRGIQSSRVEAWNTSFFFAFTQPVTDDKEPDLKAAETLLTELKGTESEVYFANQVVGYLLRKADESEEELRKKEREKKEKEREGGDAEGGTSPGAAASPAGAAPAATTATQTPPGSGTPAGSGTRAESGTSAGGTQTGSTQPGVPQTEGTRTAEEARKICGLAPGEARQRALALAEETAKSRPGDMELESWLQTVREKVEGESKRAERAPGWKYGLRAPPAGGSAEKPVAPPAAAPAVAPTAEPPAAGPPAAAPPAAGPPAAGPPAGSPPATPGAAPPGTESGAPASDSGSGGGGKKQP